VKQKMSKETTSKLWNMVNDLANWGHGITYNSAKNKYWPHSVNNGVLQWWDDPGNIANKSYEEAVVKMYYRIQPIEFDKVLKHASEVVDTWPEWKRVMLG